MQGSRPPERSTSSQKHYVRAFLVWLLIALAEMVHGTIRTLFLLPLIGDLRSRQIGVFTGSLLILGMSFASIHWIGLRDCRRLLFVGLMWLVLMLGFEISLGRLFGLSWERLVADYLPWKGGFMSLGMCVLALAPLIASRLRMRHREGV